MKARLRKKIVKTVFDADRQFYKRMFRRRDGEAVLRWQYSIVVKHRKKHIIVKIVLTKKEGNE